MSLIQQGFLPNRQLLANVIDVDFAAQTVSIKHSRGAIVLLDFRAAFPSIAHDYLWDVLKAIGVPPAMVSTLQLFYTNNRHFIRVDGKLFPSFSAENGVRQGCPLSGIIFVLCIDLLLRKVSSVIGSDGITRGYADDTAIVIQDYVKELPALARIFIEFEDISGLGLNVEKTVFIPLWQSTSAKSVSCLLKELCPPWGGFIVSDRGKYLGFMVGPGAGSSSWKGALAKYEARSLQWASKHLGLYMTTFAYRVYIQPVLMFVAQLCSPPEELKPLFPWALRRLAPGPGNWILDKDLINLRSYGMRQEFADPQVLCMAAKLRVVKFVVPDVAARYQQLLQTQSEYFGRPFGNWHYSSMVGVLAQNLEHLSNKGINLRTVMHFNHVRGTSHKLPTKSFQTACFDLIRAKTQPAYDTIARVRSKLQRLCRGLLLNALSGTSTD